MPQAGPQAAIPPVSASYMSARGLAACCFRALHSLSRPCVPRAASARLLAACRTMATAAGQAGAGGEGCLGSRAGPRERELNGGGGSGGAAAPLTVRCMAGRPPGADAFPPSPPPRLLLSLSGRRPALAQRAQRLPPTKLGSQSSLVGAAGCHPTAAAAPVASASAAHHRRVSPTHPTPGGATGGSSQVHLERRRPRPRMTSCDPP